MIGIYGILLTLSFILFVAAVPGECYQKIIRHDRRFIIILTNGKKTGVWEKMHDRLRIKTHEKEGRDLNPSAAIIDSKSVKTTEQGGPRGYDAGKKIKGRKRHILVDTIGLILSVVVHEANIQDRDGAKILLSKVIGRFPRLQLIWADGGYAGKLVEWVKEKCNYLLEIVKRSSDTKGFKVLPRRWVVERTFAWLGKHRRLNKD